MVNNLREEQSESRENSVSGHSNPLREHTFEEFAIPKLWEQSKHEEVIICALSIGIFQTKWE